MDIINTIVKYGGIFSILAFIHFFVDFILQTHAEAMVKHNNAKIRARHCIIYTTGFLPLLSVLFYNNPLKLFLSINILFWSHFYLDTYNFVYLWCKYIRKPPEITKASDPKQGFIEFVQTTLGKILLISVDQISHLTFLFPIIWMIIN